MGEQIGFFEDLDTQVKVNVITTKKLEEMILSYNQLIVILEALYNFKVDIEKLDGKNGVRMRHEQKISEINEIFEYIETGMKYDFEKAVNRCHNKHLKQLNKDDPGMETFGWIGENKKS